MTETLLEKTCIPCRGGILPLTREDAESLLAQAPEWALLDGCCGARAKQATRRGWMQTCVRPVDPVTH
jgi:hypothetical protein